MNKKLIVLGLCGLLLVTGCGKEIPKLENGQEVVAEIEGKQITADDLYTALKENGATNILINLVDEYIISKEFDDEDGAKEFAKDEFENYKAYYESNGYDFNEILPQYGYENASEFKKMLEKDYKSQEVAKKYIKENLTDDEINKYYEDEIFGAMTVKHILITPKYADGAGDDVIKAAKNEALNKANDLIKQLKNGADFETLAKENSDDSATAVNGGLFKDFEKSTTDAAFWQASYKLENDKFTETPVESAYGYHIIYKVSANEKPSLDDSKETILTALTTKKINEKTNAVAYYWTKIREKYNLNIFETDINKDYDKSVKELNK